MVKKQTHMVNLQKAHTKCNYQKPPSYACNEQDKKQLLDHRIHE